MAEKASTFLSCKILRILYRVEPVVCLVATILQIVGFSTNAWAIQLENSSNRLTKYGLWSTTVCYELDCKTKTHLNDYEENMAKGYSARGVQYALQVGHEVASSLALVSAIVCFLLSIMIIFCKVGRRQMEIGMLLTSFISGVLLLTSSGYFCGELLATMRVKQNQLRYTYYFPWGLLLSGTGAIIITLNGIILTMCACLGITLSNLNPHSVYETVTTKENVPDSEPVPHKSTDDYDPPDYYDVEQDHDDSDQGMV